MVSIKRSRLPSQESREAALAAARQLLLESGPQAVTLKAVSAKIGRTHANLLHHFGSAGGLQAALARSIADRVTGKIAEAVERARAHESDPREIVDRTFDAFDKEGAGALAAWMIISGNRDALDPILAAIRAMVHQLSIHQEDHEVPQITFWLVLMALGDSLLGEVVANALGLPRDSARRLAAVRVKALIDERHPVKVD